MLRGARPIFQAVSRTTPSSSGAAFPARTAQPSIASLSRFTPFLSRATYANKPYDKIDIAAEKEVAKKKLEARPDEVTTKSSTRHLFEPDAQHKNTGNDNVQDGLQHDIDIVKDTFQLNDVPQVNYLLGLAGSLPYLATSLTTVYLSWDLNAEWPSTSAFLNQIYLNHDSARYALDLLEPLQVGYGAVIISFLGAVHWGMEYTATKPSPSRTKFRYGIGVVAPAVAWPTLLMPVEAALITQFAAFTFLYLADSRATTRGWAPSWYVRYRFILTAVVGVAIFVSLVGRQKIGSDTPRIGQNLATTITATEKTRNVNWSKLEEQEKQEKRRSEEAAKKKEEGERAKESSTGKSDKPRSENAKEKN